MPRTLEKSQHACQSGAILQALNKSAGGGFLRVGIPRLVVTLGLVLALAIPVFAQAQTFGEYRSRQTGSWNSSSTWEEWSGSAWINASSFPSSTSLTTPLVAATATSQKTSTSGTTHTISLPAGIVSGDLLIVFWTDANGSSGSLGTPAGYTQLYTNSGGNRVRRAWYRVADGSEGSTLEVTAGTERSAHTVYRIAAGTFSGVPVVSSASSGNGSAPNPPNLSSGFGSVATLWIATSHSAGNNVANIAAPTNYTTSLLISSSGGTGNAHATTATAYRTMASNAFEDPGAFALGSNRQYAAFTVAIRGASRSATILSGDTVAVASAQSVADVTVFGTLQIQQGTTLDITSGETLVVGANGTLRLPSGDTDASSARVVGSGDFLLGENAAIEIGAPTGIAATGTGSNAGSIRNSGARTFSAAAHYTYNGVADQNLGLGFPDGLTGSLTVNNPGNTVTVPAEARTITTGTLRLVSGTFATDNGGSRLSLGNSTTEAGATIIRTGGALAGTLEGVNRHAVVFNGSSKTAGGEVTGQVGSLTVELSDGEQTLTLDADRSVLGTLHLLSGIVATGPSTLTVASEETGALIGGSANSYIDGNLARSLPAGAGSYTFPLGSHARYTPVALDFTANSEVRTVTGTTAHVDHPALAASTIAAGTTVNRIWTFSATGAGSYSVNPTFSWAVEDQDAGFDIAAAMVGQYNGGAWASPAPTVSGRTATSLSATGLTGLGAFQVGNEDNVPDAGESEIIASPAEVVADGLSASTVAVTLRNSAGNPIGVGAPVHLAVTGGETGSGGLDSAGPWVTDANGVVEATLTSTIANDVQVTASLGSDGSGELIGSALVTFVPGEVSVAASGSELGRDASESLVANGIREASLTLQLRDAQGNARSDSGVDVRFSASLGRLNGSGSPVTVQTIGGVATVSLTSTEAGSASISAEVDLGGFQAVANGSPVAVEFHEQLPDAAASSLVRSPAIVIGNGVAGATLTATVRDADGVPVSGLVAGDFVFEGGGSALVDEFTEVGEGDYTFSVTNTAVETVEIRVEVDGVAFGSFDPITFVAPPEVTTTTLPLWVAGAGNFPGSLRATGGSVPYRWNLVAPSELPAGLLLNENGTFGGVPAEAGVYSFTVQVTDANGFTATGEVAVTVNPEIIPVAELRMTVESDLAEAALGDTIVVRVTVTNEGAGTAENVVLRDEQVGSIQQQIGPRRVTRLHRVAVEVDHGTLNAETGEWTIGRIEPRGNATMTVRLVVAEP